MKRKKYFRENLNKLLASHGLNPSEFASKADIPRATIQKILNDSTENPRNTTLIAISNFFNIPLEELIYNKELKPCSKKINLIPLLKRSKIEEWLKNKDNRLFILNNCTQVAVLRDVSDQSFAIVCNEINSAIFKSGDYLVFDPAIKPSDGSYILIKLFDNDKLLFRQVSIDIGVTFVKSISDQFNSASKIREGDKIIATLIQTQTNFEES